MKRWCRKTFFATDVLKLLELSWAWAQYAENFEFLESRYFDTKFQVKIDSLTDAKYARTENVMWFKVFVFVLFSVKVCVFQKENKIK